MKNIAPAAFCIVAVATMSFVGTAVAAPLQSPLGEPAKTQWRPIKRTATQTHWQSVTFRTNSATGDVLTHTNSYVELGAGLNVRDAAGNFVPANPSFEITADGAEANGTSHKVSVPADIWIGDGIRITKPDGQKLVLQPLAIGYYDPNDGRSVVFGAVTNAVGWLTASNEIVSRRSAHRFESAICLGVWNRI